MIWYLIVGIITVIGFILWILDQHFMWSDDILSIMSAVCGFIGIISLGCMLGFSIYNWSGAYERDFNFKYQSAAAILASDNDIAKAGNMTSIQDINKEILRNRTFVDHSWRGPWANQGIADLKLLVP